jgi:SAM-dependent methyltransferase
MNGRADRDPPRSGSSVFTAEQYAEPYPPGIENHYWYRARNRILLRKLRPLLGPDTRALDVGCGPGVVVDHLRRAGLDCIGVDPGSPAPATEAVAPFLRLGTSAFDLPAALRDGFSLLLLMDVLEHLADPIAFLRECRRAFPNARHLFVTLPARMEIWSAYDEHYGHHRRYTRAAAVQLAAAAGLRAVASGYFFHALYAAARVALLAGRSKTRRRRMSAPKLERAHQALGRLFDIEEAVLPAALPGSSLYALLAAA